MSRLYKRISNISQEVTSGSAKGLVILIGFIFFVVLIVKVAGSLNPKAEFDEAVERTSDYKSSDTIVVVSEQHSEGMTERDMDAGFLSRHMDWHRSVFEEKYRAYFGDAYGSDAQAFFDSLTSEGVYTYFPTTSGGSKKLLIVRTRSPKGEVQATEINGLFGENFVRILCARRDVEVLVTQGKCGEAVKENFGIHIDLSNM